MRSPCPGLFDQGIQNPKRYGLHQCGFFGQRNELRRADDAQGRVIPANQCFDAFTGQFRQLDFRLIHQAQLMPAGEGVMERAQEHEGPLLGCVELRLIAGPAHILVPGSVSGTDHQAQPVLIFLRSL